MSKVTFMHKGGREQVMHEKFAKVLSKMGRGTYMTRDMVADRAFPGTDDHRTVHQVSEEIKAANADLSAELPDPKKRGRKPKAKE